MTYLQGEYSYSCARGPTKVEAWCLRIHAVTSLSYRSEDSVRRFNVGRVLVLNNPPAASDRVAPPSTSVLRMDPRVVLATPNKLFVQVTIHTTYEWMSRIEQHGAGRIYDG